MTSLISCILIAWAKRLICHLSVVHEKESNDRVCEVDRRNLNWGSLANFRRRTNEQKVAQEHMRPHTQLVPSTFIFSTNFPIEHRQTIQTQEGHCCHSPGLHRHGLTPLPALHLLTLTSCDFKFQQMRVEVHKQWSQQRFLSHHKIKFEDNAWFDFFRRSLYLSEYSFVLLLITPGMEFTMVTVTGYIQRMNTLFLSYCLSSLLPSLTCGSVHSSLCPGRR